MDDIKQAAMGGPDFTPLTEDVCRRACGHFGPHLYVALRDSERARALRLADTILDDPSRDPDSDVSILARQLLRADDRALTLDARRLGDAIWNVMYPSEAARSALGEAEAIAAEYVRLDG